MIVCDENQKRVHFFNDEGEPASPEEIEEIIDYAMRPGVRVRKLTQLEAWRLMGFTDEDFYRARTAMNDNLYGGKDRSGSQLYKQAGNSIVVDVLCAIMGELYRAMPYLFEDMAVGSFFSGIGAFEKALATFDRPGDGVNQTDRVKNDDLRQVGYINDNNATANRVYDSASIACTLKGEAGGGGAKTGWYTTRIKGIVDPQGRLKKRCVLRKDFPTLRAEHHGNPPEIVYETVSRLIEGDDINEHRVEKAPGQTPEGEPQGHDRGRSDQRRPRRDDGG